MKLKLQEPCRQCPFRTNITPFIMPERAEDICNGYIQDADLFENNSAGLLL